MKDRSAIEWLSEARDYALEAQKLAVDLSQESFDNDRQKQLAVSYCLVVVGEALGQLPKDVQALAPEIPWVSIKGLRNRLVHSYWLIDTKILLRIAQVDVATLATSTDRLIEKLG